MEISGDDEGAVTHALAKSEKKIEKAGRQGVKSLLEIGTELRLIRESRLYGINYRTFKEYCKERWDLSEGHVTRLIQAAEVIGSLPMGKAVPTSERQIRPLLKLSKPEQRLEAWKSATKLAKTNGQHVTAALVENDHFI